jgi:hypothetical protein
VHLAHDLAAVDGGVDVGRYVLDRPHASTHDVERHATLGARALQTEIGIERDAAAFQGLFQVSQPRHPRQIDALSGGNDAQRSGAHGHARRHRLPDPLDARAIHADLAAGEPDRACRDQRTLALPSQGHAQRIERDAAREADIDAGIDVRCVGALDHGDDVRRHGAAGSVDLGRRETQPPGHDAARLHADVPTR